MNQDKGNDKTGVQQQEKQKRKLGWSNKHKTEIGKARK